MVLACIVTKIKSRKFTVEDLRSERERALRRDIWKRWGWAGHGHCPATGPETQELGAQSSIWLPKAYTFCTTAVSSRGRCVAVEAASSSPCRLTEHLLPTGAHKWGAKLTPKPLRGHWWGWGPSRDSLGRVKTLILCWLTATVLSENVSKYYLLFQGKTFVELKRNVTH